MRTPIVCILLVSFRIIEYCYSFSCTSMASQAFERAMKKLETPSEALLADMIMRDITQLAEDAKGDSHPGGCELEGNPQWTSY